MQLERRIRSMKRPSSQAEELKKLPAEQVKVVADWWAKHYMTAGHKRLGRLLVAISKGKQI